MAPAPGSFRAADGAGLDGMAGEPAAEVGGEGGGGLVAAGGVFLQALQADRLDIAGQARVQFSQGGRLFGKNLHDQHLTLAAERQFAGQQAEQDHAQRVHVAAAVGVMRLAASLLRRHVRRGAEDCALDRHRDFARVAFGEAEVGDEGGEGGRLRHTSPTRKRGVG